MAGNTQSNQSERLHEGTSKFDRVLDGIDGVVMRIETLGMILSAVSIGAITVLVCLEVFLRSVVGSSTLIALEMSGYLLVSNVFLGLAWTLRNGGFLRIEVIYDTFGPRLTAVADFLTAIIATVILVIFTYYLCWFVLQSYKASVTSIHITHTPLWIPQLAMPIGSALLTCSTFLVAVRAALPLVGMKELDLKTKVKTPTEGDGWL